MRHLFRFVLLTTASLAALPGTGRAQSPSPSVEAGSCLGFSFGSWTPALDWHASGHDRTPGTISTPVAPGGRDWAAAPTHPNADGSILLFPSWWPVGVMIDLPARAPAPGDTVDGRATALVANGAEPSRAAVRAWLVRCGSPRGVSAAASSTANDRRPTGTWRGTSTCLTSKGKCGRDSVVYRIAATEGARDSLSLATSTIVARTERPTAEMKCRFDVLSAILSCDAPEGMLRLAVRGAEIGGRLTRHDGVDLRYVYVRRATP
jgi:hypothetical protein